MSVGIGAHHSAVIINRGHGSPRPHSHAKPIAVPVNTADDGQEQRWPGKEGGRDG